MSAPVFEVIRVCKNCERKGIKGCIVCKSWPCDLCVEHAARVRAENKKT